MSSGYTQLVASPGEPPLRIINPLRVLDLYIRIVRLPVANLDIIFTLCCASQYLRRQVAHRRQGRQAVHLRNAPLDRSPYGLCTNKTQRSCT